MTRMTGLRGRPTKAERAAAAWLVKMHSEELDAAAVRAFELWRSDPKNAEAYARTEAVWALAKRLPLTAEAEQPTRVSRTRRRLVWAGAATAAVACAALVVLVDRPSGSVLQTGVGQVKAFQLADGSRLTLDSSSRVRVHITPKRRLIALDRGRMIATVKRDRRPFDVAAAETEVRALGTVFMVSKLGEAVEVGLLEGVVSVRTDQDGQSQTVRLRAGQTASFANGKPPASLVLNASDVSWVEGRLILGA